MNTIVDWIETLPLPLLEGWGTLAYIVGFALAIAAYGGFTFRPGGRWRIGRERQAWDSKAFLSMPLTFVLIIAAGYLGSFIVLVPGAQTFESLKDLVVFLCIVLFGYPALLIVPFAYGLSDLIEGVPPDSLLQWLPGYFINPACFWIAYQLFGKNPDFRRARTWTKYLIFVVLFLSLEPVLWGYICSGKFTPAISYRTITSALFFTIGITWLIAPFAMLAALPLARRFGFFWADIQGHVKERKLWKKEWIWEAGGQHITAERARITDGWPLRIVIVTPFIALILTMVGITAYVTLKSAQDDANKLAIRLHQEISDNINEKLDEYLAQPAAAGADGTRNSGIEQILRGLPVAQNGLALIVDRSGKTIASSVSEGDPVAIRAVAGLNSLLAERTQLQQGARFAFDIITERPLTSTTWMGWAAPYQDRNGGHNDWIVLTVMPESYYLAGVQTGNSNSAFVFAIALLSSIVMAAFLASRVTGRLRNISLATRDFAKGDLSQRVPPSRMEELDNLARSFNDMAGQLKSSFDEIRAEVTERKRAEANLRVSENRLQFALRAARLAVWDWDVENNLLDWEDSMFALYDVDKSTFDGSFDSWAGCVLPEDVEQATEDVQAALRGDHEFDTQFRIRRTDGSIRYIKGVGRVIRDDAGKPLRMVGLNWDITEELVAETELRKHRDNLEELVNERTDALSVAVGQAQAANIAKSDFLANMSHEIRTPMNAVLGYAQMLMRDSSLNAQQKRKIEAIHSSGSHLLSLINDILEMSKIEAGRTTVMLQPFDLSTLFDQIEIMFAEIAKAKGIDLVFHRGSDLKRVIEGDAGKVRQVVINLLSNATKFTENGRVSVRTFYKPAGTDRCKVIITVRDTGIGIKTGDLDRIFDAFDQSGAGATNVGTGLGLAISRNFARLMHGDLTVVSVLKKGSTFTFSFEAGVMDQATRLGDEEPPGAAALKEAPVKRKVLIVDDVATNRELLDELFTEIGFDTRVATSGEEALHIYNEWPAELILMDLRMPGMGGLEAIRILRGAGSSAAIIAITASALPEVELEAYQLGADNFLRKPFQESDLFDKVEELLGKQAADPQAEARELSQVMNELPDDLRDEIREAVIGARAGRISRLAERAREHSEQAAAMIKALSENFRYEELAAALEATDNP